jgi:pimeloyl-ACP methyl ester carboxylesterase
MLTLQTLETIQKRVKLPTGVDLPYVEQGDPAGVPVILLHGITDSWHSFEPVLPHLPGSIHIFALSQRGHGDADRPKTGYEPRDFAADLAAFMDALEVGPAVITGHSMGSTIAQRFALDYPNRARGLVLVGSCPTFHGNAGLVELWEVAVSQLEDPIDPDFVRQFQESTLAQPVPPAFLDTVVQESLKLPARVWRAVLLQALLEADFSVELGKITAPTLIVWGDQDGLVSRHEQEALLAAIAGSQLVVYSGAGHAAHWEEPERFASDLVAFTENLTKSGRG